MYNLTQNEVELLLELLHEKLDPLVSEIPQTSASLISQYLVIIQKLKTNEDN